MPVHHLRTGALYCIVLASAIAGLIFGSELVRLVMAAMLALGAVPLYHAIGRDFIQAPISEVRALQEYFDSNLNSLFYYYSSDIGEWQTIDRTSATEILHCPNPLVETQTLEP